MNKCAMIDTWTFTQERDSDGNLPTCPVFTEILKLERLLIVSGIPYDKKKHFGGWIIVLNDENGEYLGDAIEHCGSYGRYNDQIEIMGFDVNSNEDGDDVEGELTAGEAYVYFERAYRKLNKKGRINFNCD